MTVMEPCQDDPKARREALADAKDDILRAFLAWLESSPPRPKRVALDLFAALYNAGEVSVPYETRAAKPRVSRNSLRRWSKQGRWSGMVPRTATNGRVSRIDADPELHDHVTALIFDKPHTKAPFLRDWLLAKFESEPERVPPLRTLQRWIRGWRKTPEVERILSQLTDPDRHRSRRMPYPGKADAGIDRLNQVWEADSTSADVLCKDGNFHLIGIIDIYSRRFRVLVTPTSNSDAIAALLRRCLLEFGVPEIWRCDRGPDYMSRRVKRLISELEITPDYCPPDDPNKKPFIERIFRTLSEGLFENLDGWKGNSIEKHQRLRARWKKSERRGKTPLELFAPTLTAAELQEMCDRWIEHVYERKPHSGLGKRTPFEVATSWRAPVKTIPNERALDVLLMKPAGSTGWASVTGKGIRTDNGVYIAAELGPLVGGPEQVQVSQDPTDRGRILVRDGEGNFICWAEDTEWLGRDRRKVEALMKAAAKEWDKIGRETAREGKKRLKTPGAAEAIIAAAERKGSSVVGLPPRRAPHSAQSLDAAEDALAAEGGPSPARRLFIERVNRVLGQDGIKHSAHALDPDPEPDPYRAVVRNLRERGEL